jgi:hypothetical protein
VGSETGTCKMDERPRHPGWVEVEENGREKRSKRWHVADRSTKEVATRSFRVYTHKVGGTGDEDGGVELEVYMMCRARRKATATRRREEGNANARYLFYFFWGKGKRGMIVRRVGCFHFGRKATPSTRGRGRLIVIAQHSSRTQDSPSTSSEHNEMSKV